MQHPILKLKIKIALFLVLSFMLMLTASRVALYLWERNYFADLSYNPLLIFLHGARFDFYVAALFLLPPLLIFFLPFVSKNLIKLFCLLFILLFAAAALYSAADLIFFHTFSKHIEIEFFTSFTHLGLFADMAFMTYWYVTYPLIILLIFVAYKTFKYLEKAYPKGKIARYYKGSVVLIIISTALMLLGIRGTLSIKEGTKNLSMMNAQSFGSQKAANLVVNGIFTTYFAALKRSDRKLYFAPPPPPPPNKSFIHPDSHYPFNKKLTSFSLPSKDYNIVLILLESFDHKYIENNPEAAPNFLKLSSSSLYFPNFYSAGRRSLIGVTAALYSLPYVAGMPYLTNGLASKNMSRVAKLAKTMGYKTLMMVTDTYTADRSKETADYLGFDEYYSKEDIPLKRSYPKFNKGFDYDGFEFFAERLDSLEDKFFAFFYTSSTHTPYNINLSPEHSLFPPDNQTNQYLNRVLYTDAALGNFFELVKEKPYFHKTIFLILPDHRAIMPRKRPDYPREIDSFYSSYLLVYAPALISPKVDYSLTWQVDILPTIMDLLNSDNTFSSAGVSVLSEDVKDRELHIFGEDEKIYILNAEMYEELDASKDIDVDALTDAQRRGLEEGEAIYRALRDNVWEKP